MSLEKRNEFEKNYEDLKSSIIRKTKVYCKNEAEYRNHLDNLKMRFGKHIRSIRRLEAADDVKTLIVLLEKRLVVGWFDVEQLHEIVDEFELNDSTVADLEDYQSALAKYKLTHAQAFYPPPYDPDIFGDVVPPGDVIPPKVKKCIIENMGNDWRFFARELISAELAVENDFDELDKSSHLSPEEKTERLLRLFEQGDKRNKRSQLSRLLKAIRRNDLDEEVTELFLENNDEE
ncbi:Hypothetical protein NTJ_05893 [Nesidiocoris tenuis]|uniref:Death domain-containing protein n=1 Tax=Nesidiocoris tenuis TaxID=355587 RepID=A0ABN7ALI6_9HEMI|nr:Hypothetical protein NTJ_05893 [Nesidiocoris tenuis]